MTFNVPLSIWGRKCCTESILNQAVCEASEEEVMRLNSVRLVRRLALVDKKWTREHGGGDDGDDGDAPAFDVETLRTLQRQFGDFNETQ